MRRSAICCTSMHGHRFEGGDRRHHIVSWEMPNGRGTNKIVVPLGQQLSLANRHTAGEHFGVAQVVRAPAFNEVTALAAIGASGSSGRGHAAWNAAEECQHLPAPQLLEPIRLAPVAIMRRRFRRCTF
jgi:hypothetical protein